MPSAATRLPARLVVVALRDHHVAAVAAAPLQLAAARGARADRRHHLEQLVADREQRVLSPNVFTPGST